MSCKRKLKFEDYQKCVKASHTINIANYLEKKGINIDSLNKKILIVLNKKEFIKNRLQLKPQQRFKSNKHIAFTREIRKIALTSNDDRRMQSIDSIEKYAHGLSKDLIWKKEKIELINLIKHYKND